jgi:acyl transferase domain-containing protein
VLALIRGSAVNQDGASNGLTAPNGPAQERVIRQALANAGLSPADVDAVEAHGTGTTLGDPIEAGAILATYGAERAEGAEPLYLGSIKSNIGHAQAAAGVAGAIKMTLALGHGELPRTLHLDHPSPHVDWSAGAVELLGSPAPWRRGERVRRAGVSSFGISGTNAHLILEEAPAPAPAPAPASPPLPAAPILLSAKDGAALRAGAGRLASHLRHNPELEAADAALTLATARARLPHRAAVLAAGREELLEGLGALAAGEPHSALAEGRVGPGKLAYLCSGQGAQRPRMGAELREAFPVFAHSLQEACEELDPHLERPLGDLLLAPEGSPEARLLERTEFTQPALFAFQLALYRLLESWGLRPDFLIGHSIGELTAAHLAGVWELPDAARLIAARGRLMGALPRGGAMVALEAAEEEVAPELAPALAIAAVNSPTSLVISGEEGAALALAERFAERGRRTSRLRVSHAFHSALMEPMLAQFEQIAATLPYREPQIPILSNLTGEPLAPEQATDPAYWVSQVRSPVRFGEGIEWLAANGASAFLELGPDAALAPMARACLAEADPEPTVCALARRERPEAQTLLSALAAAHLTGVGVDWAELFAGRGARPARLPTYPFQRRRYWLEPAAEADAAAIGLGDPDHPLLGAATALAAEDGHLLSGRISIQTHPWLADHAVLGTPILPGTAFLELALKAAAEVGAELVEELTVEAPLVLPESGAVQLQVHVGADGEDGRRPLAIHSRAGDEDAEWVRNAAGTLAPERGHEAAPEGLGEWPPAGAEPVSLAGFYEHAAELGADYGPSFQGLKAAWRRGGELFAEVALPEALEAASFAIHPALLDAALQPTMLAAGRTGEGPRVPFVWSGVRLFGAGAGSLRVRLRPSAEDPAALGLLVADAAGDPLARVEAIADRTISVEQLGAAAGASGRSLFELEWRPCEPSVATATREPRLFECDPPAGLDPPAAATALCAAVLAALQEAIAGGGEEESRLAFLTRGAVAVASGESPDPVAAAAWGLVRSAQAEHPGRFALIDADATEASAAALQAALALEAEPQLALREGALLVPRLQVAADPAGDAPPLGPEGTVLITGGTGALGSLFARHLITAHGARHLILASRRGPAAPGAAELRTELAALGAEVEIAACDAGRREEMERLLASIPPERPLRAVVHAAGVSDDGLLASLDAGRIEATMTPKAAAAWHLHELTRRIEGCELVLFSSIAASLGNPGQGNYAAANAFLDALAARRGAEGLSGASIAWGAWERESEISSRLGDADRARFARSGICRLGDAEGTALFDRARSLERPQLLAVSLDRSALRAAARAGTLPPLFGRLVRTPARRQAAAGSLAARLAALPAAEREGVARELVATHVAAVLGRSSAAALDSTVPFKDLGFDSLAAMELRNRLGAAAGLRLPATLVFDHPTPVAVARFLVAEAGGGGTGGPADLERTIDRLGAALAELDADARETARARLRSLLAEAEGDSSGAGAGEIERIEEASAEELLQIVDEEIGAR